MKDMKKGDTLVFYAGYKHFQAASTPVITNPAGYILTWGMSPKMVWKITDQASKLMATSILISFIICSVL